MSKTVQLAQQVGETRIRGGNIRAYAYFGPKWAFTCRQSKKHDM